MTQLEAATCNGCMLCSHRINSSTAPSQCKTSTRYQVMTLASWIPLAQLKITGLHATQKPKCRQQPCWIDSISACVVVYSPVYTYIQLCVRLCHMHPAHWKGSQLPPEHTHADCLFAELNKMEPSTPSEQTFLGCTKNALLYRIQTNRGGISNACSVTCRYPQWLFFMYIATVFLHTPHQSEMDQLTFSILLTTPLTVRLASAWTTGRSKRRETRNASVDNMV